MRISQPLRIDGVLTRSFPALNSRAFIVKVNRLFRL
jgi:hypothetical protein